MHEGKRRMLCFRGKGYEIYLMFKEYEDAVMIKGLFKVLKVLLVAHDMIGGGFEFEVVSATHNTIGDNAYVKTDLPVLGHIAREMGLTVVPI